METVKKVDFFSSIVGLRYSGNWRYKTVFGGFMGILASLIIAATFFFFSWRYLAKLDSKVNIQVKKEWSPPQVELTESFPFGVYIYYGADLEDRPDIIQISADYVTRDLESGRITETPIQMTKCTLEDFQGAQDDFTQLKLENAYCPRAAGRIIEGGDVSDVYSYIQVNFEICALTANPSTTCLSLEESVNKIQNAFPIAHFFAFDASFETNSYPNVVNNFINNINVKMTAKNSKETDIFISKDRLTMSEDAFIMTTETIFEEFILVGIRDKISVRADNEKNLLKFKIKSSNSTSNTNLSFMRFSELMANVGGLVNTVLLLFKAGMFIHNNIDFQAAIVNEMFRYKKESFRARPEDGEYASSANRFANESSVNNTSSAFKRANQGKSSTRAKTKNFSSLMSHSQSGQNNGNIRLNQSKIKYLMMFKPLNWCSKKRRSDYKALRGILKYFNESQDYLNIFRKSLEIDMIKYLIFDSHQQNLIRHFPKPNIMASAVAEEPRNFDEYYVKNHGHYLKSDAEINREVLKQDKVLSNSINAVSRREKVGLSGNIDEKLMNAFVPFMTG